MERLQKIISEYGIASRRDAEKMIDAGRVQINGRTAQLGQKADSQTDRITIDGNPLALRGKRVYIALYKPRGYVTTTRDERGRKTVMELLGEVKERVYPVGRLDMDSEGLLIFTNDGEMANKLTHPSFHIAKCYNVRVRSTDIESAVSTLNRPVVLDGERLRAPKTRVLEKDGDSALLSITIQEGKNRQVRRMCEIAGLKVTRLKRVSVGELTLGSLKAGRWRYMTNAEVTYLQSL